MKGSWTFWKIIGGVAATAVGITLLERFFGEMPNRPLMDVVLILPAMAIGFDCVVDAIKGEK